MELSNMRAEYSHMRADHKKEIDKFHDRIRNNECHFSQRLNKIEFDLKS